jgi:hypothetical protein
VPARMQLRYHCWADEVRAAEHEDAHGVSVCGHADSMDRAPSIRRE